MELQKSKPAYFLPCEWISVFDKAPHNKNQNKSTRQNIIKIERVKFCQALIC